MHLLTENPVPLMIVLLSCAVVAALLPKGKGRQAAIPLLLAVMAVWVVDQLVVTSGESLGMELETMLGNFKQDDLPAIHQQIDESAPGLRKAAENGLKLVQLDPGFHIRDLKVQVSESGATATAHLRANGRLKLRDSAQEQHIGTRWETTWQLQAGQWKLTGVKRLDPINGQEIGILDPA